MKCALKISCLSCPPTLCGKCGLLDPGHDHHRRHHQPSSADEDSPIFRRPRQLQLSFWITILTKIAIFGQKFTAPLGCHLGNIKTYTG